MTADDRDIEVMNIDTLRISAPQRKWPHGPIPRAYSHAAMDHECPTCHAAPHTWCQREDGQIRRTPCLSRMRINTIDADTERPTP